MQWTSGLAAGFSTSAKTWLPINPGSAAANVAAERADPGSLLNWYRRLAHLRVTVPALRNGSMSLIARDDPDVLAWMRTAPKAGRVLVAINMSDKRRSLLLPRQVARPLAVSGKAAAAGRILNLGPFAVWVGSIQ